MGGSEHHNDRNWPVTVEVTNNIIDGEVTVAFISASQHLECKYSDNFDSDTDLVFGVLGDPGDDSTKITRIIIAEENVDICEGLCASESAHSDDSVSLQFRGSQIPAVMDGNNMDV